MSATDIILHLETIEGAHRSGNLHDHPGTTERGPDCAVAQWLRDAIDWIRAADLTKAGPTEHYQCRVCMDTFVTREGREIHETLAHDLTRSEFPDSAQPTMYVTECSASWCGKPIAPADLYEVGVSERGRNQGTVPFHKACYAKIGQPDRTSAE